MTGKHRDKKVIILVLLVLVVGLIAGCGTGISNKAEHLYVSKGVLNLDEVRWENSPIIKLDGEWEFHWQKIISPAEFASKLEEPTHYLQVPGLWNNAVINGEKLPPEGYGTFRLVISSSNVQTGIALKMPAVYSAYKLWWNGELVSDNGEIGTSRELVRATREPGVISLPIQQNENQLLLQVANFEYYRGGINKSIYFGSKELLLKERNFTVIRDMFLAGAVFVTGLFYLGLYFCAKVRRLPFTLQSFVCSLYYVQY
ncbi:hypothetical protein N752_11985 [Desulforamulus aquiferis]|nr:hypothetical protein [Desulforamulus aquiferis]RYD04899.1 hypothetical protein N752_11985 [Desulforamulus aquiferis]